MAFVIVGALAGGPGLVGCSDEPAGQAPAASPSAPPSSAPAAPVSESAAAVAPTPELIAAGRSTYNANCIACHAMDPRQDGALGPAVAGSPLALLEARVMRAEYPPGYTPKRTTKVMIPLPHLQAKLPELAAYLGSLKQG